MPLLEPKSLIASARDLAGGLDDFGDQSFLEGLNALCHSLMSEARLSAMGADLMRDKLVGQLANRLRVEDYFRRIPEISREHIAAPLFIVGVPRTGTTKLHRLLAQDARFVWMSFWESQLPVPLAGETLEDPHIRRQQGQAMVDMMTQAMPQLMAIHPMDNDGADEEVMLMEHSMRSAFNAYANVPSYMKWLDAEDQAPAYRYLRRMLQFLQWQKRQRGPIGQRWVLKAPHHLLRMQVLLDEFPGAQVILTHRDPAQSIPSLASFIHVLRCIYSEHAEPASAGCEWSDIMQRAQRHTMSVRKAHPNATRTFADVDFRDTVSNPIQVLEQVYRFIDLDLDLDQRAVMRQWLAEDAKTHLGGHDYRCETYGLSVKDLHEQFGDYIADHLPHLAA